MYDSNLSTGFALSLSGGLLILVFGLALMTVTFLGLVGLICGVIMIIGAVWARNTPASRKGWGIAIVVLACVSLVSSGGLIIGFILGLIGGVMVSIEPKAPMVMARVCPRCGSMVLASAVQCGNCGLLFAIPMAYAPAPYYGGPPVAYYPPPPPYFPPPYAPPPPPQQ